MDLNAPLNAFVAGFPDFIIQLGVALGLFITSLIIYTVMTPHKELALIRAGNPSASLAYGGGATGGVVNVIPREPAERGPTVGSLVLGSSWTIEPPPAPIETTSSFGAT